MKAYIFDLDGTIVLSHPLHYAAYEKILADYTKMVKWVQYEKNTH